MFPIVPPPPPLLRSIYFLFICYCYEVEQAKPCNHIPNPECTQFGSVHIVLMIKFDERPAYLNSQFQLFSIVFHVAEAHFLSIQPSATLHLLSLSLSLCVSTLIISHYTNHHRQAKTFRHSQVSAKWLQIPPYLAAYSIQL